MKNMLFGCMALLALAGCVKEKEIEPAPVVVQDDTFSFDSIKRLTICEAPYTGRYVYMVEIAGDKWLWCESHAGLQVVPVPEGSVLHD